MAQPAAQVEPATAAVLDALSAHAAHVAGVRRVSVLAGGEDARELVLAATRGDDPTGPEDPLVQRCLTSGEAVLADDRRRFGRGGETRSAACLPLRTDGTVRGVLAVGDPDAPTRLGIRELESLGELAAALGHVLAQAQASRGLADVLEAGIAALTSLIDLRDGYAARDAGEIAELAAAVGEQLGLEGTAAWDLRIAGRVHDVGKIGVPDRILQKPGALDADERAVMERHSVWGAETVGQIPGFDAVAEIVRSHHERWDGNGYPAGLAAQAIPLGARIIGACEAYRALTSDRPYRRALDPDRAVGLLEEGAGTHFDPRVVKALIDVLRARGATSPRAAAAAPPPARGTRPPPALPGAERHALPAAFERLDRLPALTESRDRLLALLRTPEPSVNRIVEAVESDVALVIALLRLANRRSAKPIAGVREAVELLSPTGVEQLATEIATAGFFERGGAWPAPPEPFRAHAAAVQRAADRLAREVDHRHVDELLVAALLHDVGQLVLGHAYPGYPASVHGDARTPDDRIRAERRALGVDHALVGGVLLRRWGMPARLARWVERHHSDDEAKEVAMLRLADQLAHYTHGRPVDPRRLLEAARRVGLSSPALRAVMFELPTAGLAKRRAPEACPLTQKELQALRGLAAGKVYKEIAVDLGIAPSTVRSHLHKTYKKLGASDRAQAVLTATERGWL